MLCSAGFSAEPTLTSVLSWGGGSNATNVPPGLTNAVTIAAGFRHSVALRSDGTVIAWGENNFGQTNVPFGLTDILAIAAGLNHSLALRNDGTVVGWGDNASTQASAPPGLSNVVAIAAGQNHSLALRSDGIVVAWGTNDFGQKNIPKGLSNVVAIAAGANHNLAQLKDGTLVSWGNNSFGQTNVPLQLTNVQTIAAGSSHSLALRADGTVIVWGNNPAGTSVPPGLSNVVAISAGNFHDLALRADGSIVAWGIDQFGVTNVPTDLPRSIAIAAGRAHNLVITRPQAPPVIVGLFSRTIYSGGATRFQPIVVGTPPLRYQWRLNGQALIGATNASLQLNNVQATEAGVYTMEVSDGAGVMASAAALLTVRDVAPEILLQPVPTQILQFGRSTTLGVIAGGSAPLRYQWRLEGMPISGATNATLLLNRSTAAPNQRYSVLITNPFGSVESTPALLDIPQVVAWGDNTFGQNDLPFGLTNVVAVAIGGAHSLALRRDGTVVAWGANAAGQSNVPPGLSNVIAISASGHVEAGSGYSLALRNDGTVVGWGHNSAGQTDIPANLSNVVAIASGYHHVLALRNDGTVVAWGENGDKQSSVPLGLSDVTAIAAGQYHSLAVRRNGQVEAWGIDLDSQIDVPPLFDAVGVAAGWYHSLALHRTRNVTGWGYDGIGQLAFASTLSDISAVASAGNHNLALHVDSTITSWDGDSSAAYDVPLGLSNVVAIAAGPTNSLVLLVEDAPPTILGLSSQTIFSGKTLFLRADAVGNAPLQYQWFRDGRPVTGATNPVLRLENVGTSQAGEYVIAVTDGRGGSSSFVMNVNVLQGFPDIVTPPASQVAYPGQAVTFRASANGSVPLFYQWRFNGMDIVGARNSVLVLNSVTASQSGHYSVVVSNAFGRVESADAFLEISQVFAWGRNDSGQLDLPFGLTNVVGIAAGDFHGLALRHDGTVLAWGDNDNGQAIPPLGLSNVVAIAAGLYHSLALRNDGTVVGWGADDSGQIGAATGRSNVVAIAAGWYHSLMLLSDGTVAQSGSEDGVQTEIRTGLSNVVAIAAGGKHSLALRNDGTVVAWGENSSGETNIPTGLSNVVAVAAGPYQSVALRDDGHTWFWGDNYYLQGDIVRYASNVVAVAVGADQNVALVRDGTVGVYGDSSDGQRAIPPGLNNAVAIASGEAHVLALARSGYPPSILGPALSTSNEPMARTVFSGEPLLLNASAIGTTPLRYQWKWNGLALNGATNAFLMLNGLATNQAGDFLVEVTDGLGNISRGAFPVTVRDGPPKVVVSPTTQAVQRGERVHLSVQATGSRPLTFRWRHNQTELDGASGPGLTLNAATAADAGEYEVIVSNAFGTDRSTTAFLEVNTRLVAWGDRGARKFYLPLGLTNPVALAAGLFFDLGLRPDGTVVAWGDDSEGNTSPPDSLGAVLSISASSFHSLALRRDGSVAAWGFNRDGQCNVPNGLSNVVAVAAGRLHSLALRSDGTVVAWGNNADGEADVPPTLRDVVAIAGGGFHSLALRRDGTVLGWGYNYYGQSAPPARVTNVVAIEAGLNHSMALRSDGIVVSWGNDERGQLDGPGGQDFVAIAAGDDHSVALHRDGRVTAWGWDYYGQLSVPSTVSNAVAIAAGGVHNLALIGDGTPALTLMPNGQTVQGGEAVTFHARAAGNLPLSYQWQFNGTNLIGATNASLFLPHAQLADTGTYSLIVTNTRGAVTSQVASLRVLVTPSVRQLPPVTTVRPGTNITFTSTFSGTPPLLFQWRKNGVNIPGATNDSLTITNVQLADGGSYSLVVANALGTSTSEPGLLLVDVPEVVPQPPPEDFFANRRSLAGTNGFATGTNLFATREPDEPRHAGKFGTNSVWYTWRAPASGIATFHTVGSTFDTLLAVYTNDVSVGAPSFSNLGAVASDEDRGGFLTSEARFSAVAGVDYQIAVDGFAGQRGDFTLGWNLELTAETLPRILATPVSQTVTQGATTHLTVLAVEANLTYQWYFERTRIPDATNAVLSLINVQPANVGYYTVAVTNSAGVGLMTLPAAVEIGSESGSPVSEDKLEDLLFPDPNGTGQPSPLPFLAVSVPGAPTYLVGAGSITSHLWNNSQGSTSAGEENHCGAICRATRWFFLQATNSGTLVLRATAENSNGEKVRPLFAVYAAPLGILAATEICSELTADVTVGRAELPVLPGTNVTRYAVVADMFNSETGRITMEWALGSRPKLNNAPANLGLPRGSSLTLTALVTQANPPPFFQWSRDGALLAGATNATLTLNGAGSAEEGSYAVSASNAIGVAEANVATVKLERPSLKLAESDFDDSLETWWLDQPGFTLVHTNEAGTHAGCLVVKAGVGGTLWYWRAPNHFLGNLAALYGGYVQFDLKDSSAGQMQTNAPLLELTGGGLALVYFEADVSAHTTNWTTYRVPMRETTLLREGQWFKNAWGGPTPTREEMLRALSDVTSLRIRGRANPGLDGRLDNVALNAVCADNPLLTIQILDEPYVALSWPANAFCYQLSAATSLHPILWTTNVPVLSHTLSNGEHRAVVVITNAIRFFKLTSDF